MNTFLKLFLKLHFGLWGLSLVGKCLAQPMLYPLPSKIFRPNLLRTTGSDTIPLPFFDDFSTSFILPDSSLWQNSEDVFINNGFSSDHPTSNIATFDGLLQNGQPYVTNSPFAVGLNDKLTSCPLALEDITNLETLVFSFWWQAGGRGESPNAEDSLILQIKQIDGLWINLWSVSGSNPLSLQDTFNRIEVTLNNSDFFYNGFQFRFTNYGRQSGAFDHWNIDYVYVYDSAADKPSQRVDVALSGNSNGLFKNYYAIPFNHFQNDPTFFLRDTITVRLNNLSPVIPSPIRLGFHLTDLTTQDTVSIFQLFTQSQTPSSQNVVLLLNNESAQLSAINNTGLPFYNLQAPTKIRHEFRIDAVENSPTSPNFIIPTQNNDTLRSLNILEDYFSYDDGTAEAGVSVNVFFGSLAHRFILDNPDTLTHIDIHLPRNENDLSSETFDLFVWKKIDALNDANDEILFSRNITINYSEGLNTFQRYEVDNGFGAGLILSDTFYIGVRQRSQEPLILGFDMNTKGGNNIFFNVSSQWQQNKSLNGSLMLRPIFEKLDIVTALEPNPTSEEPDILVYPNPASNFFKIQSKQPVRGIKLYTVYGNKILEKNNLSEQNPVFKLEKIPSGLYILFIDLGNKILERKLLIY